MTFLNYRFHTIGKYVQNYRYRLSTDMANIGPIPIPIPIIGQSLPFKCHSDTIQPLKCPTVIFLMMQTIFLKLEISPLLTIYNSFIRTLQKLWIQNSGNLRNFSLMEAQDKTQLELPVNKITRLKSRRKTTSCMNEF